MILGLRKGEEIPTWVTHVLDVQGGTAFSRKNTSLKQRVGIWKTRSRLSHTFSKDDKNLVVDLKNVNVSYGDRSVSALSSLNPKIE